MASSKARKCFSKKIGARQRVPCLWALIWQPSGMRTRWLTSWVRLRACFLFFAWIKAIIFFLESMNENMSFFEFISDVLWLAACAAKPYSYRFEINAARGAYFWKLFQCCPVNCPNLPPPAVASKFSTLLTGAGLCRY